MNKIILRLIFVAVVSGLVSCTENDTSVSTSQSMRGSFERGLELSKNDKNLINRMQNLEYLNDHLNQVDDSSVFDGTPGTPDLSTIRALGVDI